MHIEADFSPCPFLGNPHAQTILSCIIRCPSHCYFERSSHSKRVALPDGDQIALEVTTPKNWRPTDLSVVLIHGLCGSHRSNYLIRMAKRLRSLGIRAIRCNLRGCGSGMGLAKQFYHGGCSEDVLEILKALKKEDPQSPIALIGFSLGGNVALKLCGELKRDAACLLKQVIAVNPPIDLSEGSRMINHPSNSFYNEHFFRYLRAYLSEHLRHFPRSDISLPTKIDLRDFDEQYTAPLCGFANAVDYYAKSSSLPLIPHIAIPCKILFSEDDPFIASHSLDNVPLPPNVQLFKTKKGGHLGFLGNPFHKSGFRWLDTLLLNWLLNK